MNLYIALTEKVSVRYFKKLRELAAPLLEQFGIVHFYYGMLSNEGSFAELGTNLDALHNYGSSRYFMDNPFLRLPKYINPGVYPHQPLDTASYSKFEVAAFAHQIRPFVRVVEKTPNGLIHFGFDVRTGSSSQEILILNELPLLRKFVEYFCREAADVIHCAKENSISIAALKGNKFLEDPRLPKPQLSYMERASFLMNIAALDSRLVDVQFTKRELECIQHRLELRSASETSKILGLSARTVSNYLENIKTKLNCQNKTDFRTKLEQLRTLIGYRK